MRSESGSDAMCRRTAHAAPSRTLRLVAAICLPCLPASAAAQGAGASTFESTGFAPMTLAPARGMESAKDKQNAAIFYDMATSGRGLTQPIDAYDVIRSGKQLGRVDFGARYADTRGGPKQAEAALAWAREAARQDNREVMFLLGRLLLGSTEPAARSEGLDWLKRSAELGLPEAQYELASMYAQGHGVTRDQDTAINWARKAADQGHEEAHFSVGRVLIESRDSDSKAEAIRHLESAAAKNHTKAAIFLASVLARGDFGVPKDEAKAERLLKQFADRGDAECQMALASLYKIGDSFVDQRNLADEWLRRAAAGGNQRAAQILMGRTSKQASP